MFPNSFNNFNHVNPNQIPMQYPPPQQNQYSYFNPYQAQQPMMPNMQTMPPEQQYYMQQQPMQPMQPIQPMQPMQPMQQMQPMQPMYYPYMQQQPMYNPMFIPQNPQMMPNNNMYHQNQNQRQHNQHNQHNKQQNHNQNQNQRRPPNQQQHQQHQQQQQQPQRPVKIRNEVDPNKPEHTKDEIMKWIEQRKKNFPSKANIARRELENKLKEETGEIVEPALSILEKKLRRRISVLGMIDGKANRKKEFERNYLLKCVTNPYKKLKTTTLGHPSAEEKEEKTEKGEKGEQEQVETQKNEEENKEKEENKDMYDAFKEFQMQINKIEDEKPEDGEVRDDDEPVERKIITEKHLEKRIAENNKDNKRERFGKTDRPFERKGKKILPKNLKKTPKPVDEEPESEKKTESIEDIIANLRQRKDKDDQEFSKVLEGTANTADFKYKSNTLLANLLIDSIYQEKNVILQCLRYITRENFFDKPQ